MLLQALPLPLLLLAGGPSAYHSDMETNCVEGDVDRLIKDMEVFIAQAGAFIHTLGYGASRWSHPARAGPLSC